MENVSHRAWGRPSVSQIQDSPSKTTHSRLMKQLRREPARQQAMGTESTYIPLDVTIGVTPVAVAHLSSFTDTVLATRKPYCMMKQRPEALTPIWQECNVLGRQVTTPTSESTWISITILPTPTTTDTTSDVTSTTTTSSDASVTDTSSTSSESSSTSIASSLSTIPSTTSDLTSSYTTSSEFTSESSFSTSSSSAYTPSLATSSTYTISSSPTSYSWASPSTYWPNPTTSWYTVVSTSWVTESETVTQFSGTTASPITSASPLQSFASTTTITSTGLLSTDGPDGGNSLSRNTGAVIGVAVSAAVVVVLIAIGVFFACRRYRRSASEPSTEQPQFVPSWRPPLAGDDDSSLGATITATSTVGHRVSSGQIPYIDPREMGRSPPSSEGLAPSSHGHSSIESSSHALLTRSRSSSVGKHMRAEEAPPSEEEEFLNRLRTRRSTQVSELVIPPVPRIPSTIQLPPTSPISPASSTYPSSLLNPPPLPLEPPAPAYVVQSSSSWPPPPMQVPAFGMHAPEGLLHPLVGLEQTESVTSFRDHMDYSRPILPRRVDRGEEESI
ncbi:hypothetical protein ARMSODRAFT_960994 [Armillaria solidipes]|uniref:REJ domain-containing protein n=1 Tax=Armillaria solidipes TaxID=1076256 RepID=A0A2H3BP35_9AGAR|nr:hypothetical protein ARMSODRAFT_960994 [Armillaria solidipes]